MTPEVDLKEIERLLREAYRLADLAYNIRVSESPLVYDEGRRAVKEVADIVALALSALRWTEKIDSQR